MILIPKYQDLNLDLPLTRAALTGRYKLTKGKGDIITGETDWIDNIITNNGLDKLGTTLLNSATTHCHVGTGTALEVATDTALGTFVASSSTLTYDQSSVQGSAPYYYKWLRTFRFGEGVAAGNIAELGISDQAATGDLFSRVRVKDGGGSPTTITVLSDEWLDVSYELRVYPAHATADATGSVTIGGVSYNYTQRAAWVTTLGEYGAASTWASWRPVGALYGIARGPGSSLGVVTSSISGGTAKNLNTDVTPSYSSYTPGTYNMNMTLTFGLNEANISGGVLTMYLTTYFNSIQIAFNNPIPKDNTKVMTYTTNVAWTRATIP